MALSYQELAEVYNWFSEGFDTPDLMVAKVLPEPLNGVEKPIETGNERCFGRHDDIRTRVEVSQMGNCFNQRGRMVVCACGLQRGELVREFGFTGWLDASFPQISSHLPVYSA